MPSACGSRIAKRKNESLERCAREIHGSHVAQPMTASNSSSGIRTVRSRPTIPLHIRPRKRNARPPNILRSVTSCRRFASCSSHATKDPRLLALFQRELQKPAVNDGTGGIGVSLKRLGELIEHNYRHRHRAEAARPSCQTERSIAHPSSSSGSQPALHLDRCRSARTATPECSVVLPFALCAKFAASGRTLSPAKY